MKRISFAAPAGAIAAAAILLASTHAMAQSQFSDDFNTAASAANYTFISDDVTSSFPTFAYDYSVLGIPSAPNSGGSTIGLKLDANLEEPGRTGGEGMTVHTIASYSGDYAVKFDAFIQVVGPFPAGGNGSTNYLTAGVGGNPAVNNRPASSANVNAVSGAGGWTAVNGDNGNGNDYRLYKDNLSQAPATGQYAATDTNPDAVADNTRNGETNPYYSGFGGVNVDNFPVQGAAQPGGFASQTGTTYDGGFGMKWHEVELRVVADGGTGGAPSMTWFIDGRRIGTLDAGANGSFSATGSVALGYTDPSTNNADDPALSFGLIDNLSVVVPEPGALSLMAVAAMGAIAVRRRRNG